MLLVGTSCIFSLPLSSSPSFLLSSFAPTHIYMYMYFLFLLFLYLNLSTLYPLFFCPSLCHLQSSPLSSFLLLPLHISTCISYFSFFYILTFLFTTSFPLPSTVFLLLHSLFPLPLPPNSSDAGSDEDTLAGLLEAIAELPPCNKATLERGG